MKIKQTNIEHKRILELQLIKSRTYEQYTNNSNTLDSVNLVQIVANFKKALKIIFKYHQKNKKILFLGITIPLMKKINQKTNHVALPIGFRLQGLLSNNSSKFKTQTKTQIKYLLPKLKTKPDLIIIFNEVEKNESILRESYSAKIPTIIFTNTFKKRTELHSYNVPGNSEFLFYHSNIFYTCLNFLFKKQYLSDSINQLYKAKNETKKRYKPFYKNFLRLRENIQDRPKVFKFKKQKWKKFQQAARRQLRFFRRYRIKDQFQLSVPKFASRGNSFQKRFRNTLRERKIFSFFYGILKKNYLKKHLINSMRTRKSVSQFSNYKHKTVEFFESRLDTILYRAKFSLSMKGASQLILHGHVLVNGSVVRTKSYNVSNNDLIEIICNIKSKQLVKKSIDRSNFWPIPPKHLVINYSTFQILFINDSQSNMLPVFNHYLHINSLLANIKKY